MAFQVSMAPREASGAPGLARGPRGPGSYAARTGQRSAASTRGCNGRPARLEKACGKGDKNKKQVLKCTLDRPHPVEARQTSVADGAFKEAKLSDCRGKHVVLFFYPLDFTFVCPTDIIAFSEHAEDFCKLGCEVLGVSVDLQFSHLAWINTPPFPPPPPPKEGDLGPLNIPLLADGTRSLSRDYGVLKKDERIASRGLFIMDGKGVLRQITVNDLPVGRSVDEALRLVQAFQYTDEHREVCPAGWKPGSDTIKPSVDDSKEYFSKHS